MKKTPYLFAFVSVLIVGAWAVIQYSGDGKLITEDANISATLNQFDKKIASLDQEKQQLQTEIKTLQNNQNDIKALLLDLQKLLTNQSQPNKQQKQAAVNNQKPMSLSEKDIQASEQQYVQQLRDYTTTQSIDQEWAIKAEADIQRTYDNLADEGSHLELVNCYSTMCSIEFSHDNINSMDNILDEFAMKIPWDHDGYVEVNNQTLEKPKTVFYISREGHKIPARN